jgi:hypothetical protein
MAATDTPVVAECGGNNPCIVVPGDAPWTDKEITHQARQFVTLAKMNGGAVCGRAQTLNTIPALIFANPYLVWGGNEDGGEFVSGHGNFGNLLGYENVEKAILVDQFVSMTHFLYTKKRPFDRLMAANAQYMMRPSWMNLTRTMSSAVRANLARKDF